MGADTKGYLNKNITATQIYNIITSKYDKDAIFDIRIDYDNKEMGHIYFKDRDDNRGIFYCVTGDKEENTEFANGEEHVNLSLGCWNNSVEIITEIVKFFGGYIDESDCDDIGSYYIPKGEDFQYSEYLKKRNEIMNVLTKELSKKDKMKIANEILSHSEGIKNLL